MPIAAFQTHSRCHIFIHAAASFIMSCKVRQGQRRAMEARLSILKPIPVLPFQSINFGDYLSTAPADNGDAIVSQTNDDKKFYLFG
jgi:hypothetical protein